jgi:hypothetical protein
VTAAEALISALERASGDALVLQAGACPYVTDAGATREIGSDTVSGAMMQALVTELVPDDMRFRMHRGQRVLVRLASTHNEEYLLTVNYTESRFSLRLERSTPIKRVG